MVSALTRSKKSQPLWAELSDRTPEQQGESMTELKKRMLVFEAKRWVGIKEVGGQNKGQVVEMFQKAVDGKASGEPWCLAFVQFCLQMVDKEYDFVRQMKANKAMVFNTEHCLTLWNNTNTNQRRKDPEIGTIVLWRHGDTTSGHAGIVTEILEKGEFRTVEGNTGDGSGVIREGDGVFERVRSINGAGSMKILGFVHAWL
jgi:hypothetical protein